jgi:hypothetical protein
MAILPAIDNIGDKMKTPGLRSPVTLFVLSALMAGCGGGDSATPATQPQSTKLLATVTTSSFGLTQDANFFTIDTGSGLVFKVRRLDNGVSTQSAGDIASMMYNGVQYQDQARGTQVNSGFDFLYTGVSAVTVDAETVGTDYIKVTVKGGNLTHYYMAKRGACRSACCRMVPPLVRPAVWWTAPGRTTCAAPTAPSNPAISSASPAAPSRARPAPSIIRTCA